MIHPWWTHIESSWTRPPVRTLVEADGGCSACHIPRRRGGTYQGADPTIDRMRPGEPLMHHLQGTQGTRVSLAGKLTVSWTGMSMDNCFQCHFDPRQIQTSVLGSIRAHYTGHRDETGGGLLCQDCHTSVEMHGDGNIAVTNDAQREVNCEDCHGTTQRFPWELPLSVRWPPEAEAHGEAARGLAAEPLDLAGKRYPARDGYLLTSRGNPFGNLVKDGSRVLLYSASGSVHEVTLLKQRATQDDWRSDLAREVKASTTAHASLSCTDCHAEWAPPCYGCHAQEDGSGNRGPGSQDAPD